MFAGHADMAANLTSKEPANTSDLRQAGLSREPNGRIQEYPGRTRDAGGRILHISDSACTTFGELDGSVHERMEAIVSAQRQTDARCHLCCFAPQQLSGRGRGGCSLARGQFVLKQCNILKQPLRNKLEKIKSELRVLVV